MCVFYFVFPFSAPTTKGDKLLPLPGHGAKLCRGSTVKGLLVQHLFLPQAVWWRRSPGGGTRCSEALDQGCRPFPL